jgi:CheY-like chemotaxis protein
VARKVLLVDPDHDALGQLSAVLRGNGFQVVLADSVESAIERAREATTDVVVASADLCGPGALLDQLKAIPELGKLPSIVLAPPPPHALPVPEGQAARDDTGALVARIGSVIPRPMPVEGSQGEVRGDLSQVPLVDLLQVLSMNRRTGALSVTTSLGAGEVRIGDGEVLDAVYRRLEGEKALYRLLGEREGIFAFVPGGTVALRRVSMGTSMLIMEAMRHFDEVDRLKKQLAPGGDVLITSEPVQAGAPKTEREVMAVLQTPHSIDEVLDDVHAPDLDVLQAIEVLSARGALRRIPRAAMVTRLASEERLQVLRALASRLCREGFSGAPRIAFAAPAQKLASMANAILRIEDSVPPPDPLPSAPVPHLLATIRLGDAVELGVIGLPLAAQFSPLWMLTLAGAGAVVRLDGADCPELDLACAAAEVPLLHAAALLGEVEEADPAQLAALLRLTLETASGA